MAAEEGASARGFIIPALAPPPLKLLDRPLDYLLADHFRQRSLCAELRKIVDTRRAGRGVADAVAAFLMTALKRHHDDLEDALFPALRPRVRPEDGMGTILAQLIEDHRHTESMCEDIVDALAGDATADPVEISQAIAELMLAFADNVQRHLAVENGIVMVIARKRLAADDLKVISQRMKLRRGIAV